MKSALSWQISAKPYQAQACIVWCYDWRFQPALKKILKAEKIKKYDLICLAGGAKSLSSPNEMADRAGLLQQINTSIKLHYTKHIILMLHTDCGAYKGSFTGKYHAVMEMNYLQRELIRAKQFLKKYMLDDITIETVLVDFIHIHYL